MRDSELTDLGSKLAKGMSSRPSSGVNISYGTVKAVNDTGGTVSLNVYVHGGTLYGIPMTTACCGVQVGDRVVVETYGNLSTVTGVIARNNYPYKSHVGMLIFLRDGTTPSDAGYSGSWRRVYVYITSNNYNVIDIQDGNDAPGTNIQLYSYNGGGAQQWHLFADGDQGGQFYAWICTSL